MRTFKKVNGTTILCLTYGTRKVYFSRILFKNSDHFKNDFLSIYITHVYLKFSSEPFHCILLVNVSKTDNIIDVLMNIGCIVITCNFEFLSIHSVAQPVLNDGCIHSVDIINEHIFLKFSKDTYAYLRLKG